MTMTDVAGAAVSGPARATPQAPSAAGFVRTDEDGTRHLTLLVDGISCAKCIRDIEKGVTTRLAVRDARLNFSTRRLHVTWDGPAAVADDVIETVARLGFTPKPLDGRDADPAADPVRRRLLACLAVAGFASANVMLLSVSVWAGGEMTPETRDLMHAVSGLIALPAVAFAGRPFFFSALGALRGGRINMDVPISLAVILASVLSVVKTLQSGDHAYFDACVMLLFFLLIGRYLDHAMRSKARSAAADLLALQARDALVLDAAGAPHRLPVSAVRTGERMLVPAGDRVPVDSVFEPASGAADTCAFDVSLLTGESAPQTVAAGETVYAGAVNMGDPVLVRATRTSENSLIAEIVALMETAEQGRSRYRRLSDRAAGVYAPMVHAVAALTFAGWWIATGHWAPAAETAIAVLIITCPCALGLAVPVVQVVASGALFRRGILVKSADGLERLAEVDAVVFDKTGTLTLGRPSLANGDEVDPADLALAARLARASRHPLSRALAEAAGPGPVFDGVEEVAGCGLAAQTPDGPVRLGKAAWCGAPDTDEASGAGPCLWLRRPDGGLAAFRFEDPPRADAALTVKALKGAGLHAELVSGDARPVAEMVARAVGLDTWQGRALPQDKIARLDALDRDGRRVLMVGDGLNDAPALAHAHASISPASAADISQTSADFVFQGALLAPVMTAWRVSKAARRLVLQNFGLAALYNLIAVPVAVSGLVTPLIAAIAMSASSVIVTLNALRLTALAGKAPVEGDG
ncbi:MAG: heavy metal translocating P-type ATPase [Alphaproteobacteria bacterium]